jgi:hypothetical protein
MERPPKGKPQALCGNFYPWLQPATVSGRIGARRAQIQLILHDLRNDYWRKIRVSLPPVKRQKQ